MAGYHSKRARILGEVLEYVNVDDWDDLGDFLVFGKEAFETWCESPLKLGEADSDRGLRRAVDKMKVGKGRREVARRVGIEQLPPDSTMNDFMEYLSKTFTREELRRLTQTLAKAANSEKPGEKETQLAFDSDAVDAALAAQFVQLLDKTIGRIGSFDDLEIRQTHPAVARYFDEAHRCLLFGLDIACAVLCRGLLESALIERIDPQRKLKQELKRRVRGRKGQQDSYLSEMVKTAEKKGILTVRRGEAADKIKEAGNFAIHNYEEFRKRYLHRMDEMLKELRNVLVDLYK